MDKKGNYNYNSYDDIGEQQQEEDLHEVMVALLEATLKAARVLLKTFLESMVALLTAIQTMLVALSSWIRSRMPDATTLGLTIVVAAAFTVQFRRYVPEQHIVFQRIMYFHDLTTCPLFFHS